MSFYDAQSSITKQFQDSNIYIPKLEILSVAKTNSRNYVVKATVLDGIVQNGDIIKVRLKDGSKTKFLVNNVYVNSQQTTIGVAGEIVEIITPRIDAKVFSQFKEKHNQPTLKGEVISRELVESLSIGMSVALYENKKIDESKYHFLIECPMLRQKVINFLEDENTDPNLIKKIATAGLNALKDAKGKLSTKKIIGITAALGIFGFTLYNKLSKSCLTKIGKAKLICQKQAVDKVIAELNKQSANCNTIQDPIQRRKCLRTVESKKRNWIAKSTKLGTEIAKYKG